MATHPDYWRQGAATQLCRWGLDEAKVQGVAITLLSSPMGEGLYSKLGFKVFGLVRMQVEGEIEALEYPVMAYEPKSMYED